jgi:hypothetical protein
MPRGGARKGAGRKPYSGPKGPSMQIVKVALLPHHINEISAEARRRKQKRSQLLREITESWLRSQKRF